MILKNSENSGMEEIGLVTPTPGRCDRSYAAVTPVGYECDWKDLTGNFE